VSDHEGPARLSATGLLRHNRPYRSLWLARTVSFAGDSLSLVALMFHVAQSAGQALAVSLLLLVGDFAPSLLSPITGAISDRFNLRRVMITAELVQGAVLVVIALTLPPLPVLLALVAVRALAGQVFQPASRAAVPALVPARDLESANATIGLGTNAGEAAGPLLAAAVFPFIGVRGVLLVDAATFLASAALLATLPRGGAPNDSAAHDGATPGSTTNGSTTNGSAAPASLFAQARAGLGYLLATPSLRVIALGFCAIVAFNGVDDVALVVLATDTYGAGGATVGLLLGAVGLGLFVGYFALSRPGALGARAMPALLVAGFAASSVGNLLTGLAWAVAAAVAMQAFRGVGIAAMDVASTTLLQRIVPAPMLGRVFGNLYGAIGVAAAASYVAGGLLLDATSAPVTLIAAGAAGTAATVVVAVRLPRALRQVPPRQAEP
jgi:MFS family permease